MKGEKMKLTEIEFGKTGYTNGYGCDSYPHTIWSVGKPYNKRGRKPKGWITGTQYIDFVITSDEVKAIGKDEELPEGCFECNGDTGFEGVHKRFKLTPVNPEESGRSEGMRAKLLPDGTLQLDRGCFGHYHSRDSSF